MAAEEDALPVRCELKTPAPANLTQGARWQVEDMPLPIALRAMANVLGADYGKAVKDGWSTDYAYVLTGAACGDLFTFGLHIRAEGATHDLFRRFPPDPWRNALRRGLDALGYGGEVLVKGQSSWGDIEAVKARILRNLADGRPVLVVGLPKPEHVALITGYEADGEVLTGWSCEGGGPSILFEPGERKEFGEWRAVADLVLLCGAPLAEKADARVYRDALAQGLELLQRRADAAYLAGPSLYEAWAKAFEAPGDEGAKRAGGLIDPYVWDLAERRHYAREFCQRAAQVLPAAGKDLDAAAVEFGAIHDLMWKLFRTAGGQWPGDPTPKLTDPAARRQIAALICEAAAHDAKAAGLIAAALKAE